MAGKVELKPLLAGSVGYGAIDTKMYSYCHPFGAGPTLVLLFSLVVGLGHAQHMQRCSALGVLFGSEGETGRRGGRRGGVGGSHPLACTTQNWVTRLTDHATTTRLPIFHYLFFHLFYNDIYSCFVHHRHPLCVYFCKKRVSGAAVLLLTCHPSDPLSSRCLRPATFPVVNRPTLSVLLTHAHVPHRFPVIPLEHVQNHGRRHIR